MLKHSLSYLMYHNEVMQLEIEFDYGANRLIDNFEVLLSILDRERLEMFDESATLLLMTVLGQRRLRQFRQQGGTTLTQSSQSIWKAIMMSQHGKRTTC